MTPWSEGSVWDGSLPFGAVAQGSVAAGYAHRVNASRTKLLVPGRCDEARSGRRTRLSVVDSVRFDEDLLLAHVLHVYGAVDDKLRGGAVAGAVLTLITLDLKEVSCAEKHSKQSGKNERPYHIRTEEGGRAWRSAPWSEVE